MKEKEEGSKKGKKRSGWKEGGKRMDRKGKEKRKERKKEKRLTDASEMDDVHRRRRCQLDERRHPLVLWGSLEIESEVRGPTLVEPPQDHLGLVRVRDVYAPAVPRRLSPVERVQRVLTRWRDDVQERLPLDVNL